MSEKSRTFVLREGGERLRLKLLEWLLLPPRLALTGEREGLRETRSPLCRARSWLRDGGVRLRDNAERGEIERRASDGGVRDLVRERPREGLRELAREGISKQEWERQLKRYF